MKIFAILLLLVSTSFAETFKIECRVTYYSVGKDSDYFTRKRLSSTGKTLKNKVSAAVDPKIIPYGSKIHLPEMDMSLVAVDTGSAVKSKKASKAWGKKSPIIDVFIDNPSKVKEYEKKYPMFTIAIIELPN